MMLNIHAGWIGILAGVIAGLLQGAFFHKDEFLGGYTSWSRRLTRLGHISLFGLGFINLAFALTAQVLGMNSGLGLPSMLFVIGAVSMPIVCYTSAFFRSARHLFFVPVISVAVATSIFVWRLLSI